MNRFDNKRVLEMIEKMDIEEKLLCVHGQLWDPSRANQAGFVRGNKRRGWRERRKYQLPNNGVSFESVSGRYL